MPADLLRFATAGSVDDGKSTLIGRLLYDSSRSSRTSSRPSSGPAASAATTTPTSRCSPTACAPSASRASRSTSPTATSPRPTASSSSPTPPGHIQYTRNMVTGASTADLALVLVDARKGLIEQTRRHAFLATLLRVPHLVLCVNKMDLVDYDRGGRSRRSAPSSPRSPPSSTSPTSRSSRSRRCTATTSSTASEHMPWYDGPSLLHHLENVHVASDRNLVDVRFPVQYVIRPQSTTATTTAATPGQVAGGVLKPGDEVVVLPSRLHLDDRSRSTPPTARSTRRSRRCR